MKKKILHILVLPKLAGSQMVALEILKSLPDECYEKWVLFSNVKDCGDKTECVRRFEQVGVKVVFSDKLKRNIGLKDFSATVELYRLCKKEKFDIVHTHSTKPGIIGRIAATLASVPLVVHTVHGLAFHNYVKFPRWQFYWVCEMFASLFCDKIALVNQYYKKYFSWFGRKVITIYNGIDFSALPALKDKREKENISILFVGRLDIPKDPLTLLRAAKIVIGKYPKTHFTLVGDGEKYDECEEFIKQVNLRNNVTLAGWQNNVSDFYQTHDIFALSSIYESFGLIFLEAGYYNLPSVTTNVEGIPEVIVDNMTGLLCNPRDPETFAANLIYLIEHPEWRTELGKNAHKRVVSLYSSEKMVQAYRKLYQKEYELNYKIIDN